MFELLYRWQSIVWDLGEDGRRMLEDRVLVWRLNRGSVDALARIYEKYRDDLLRLALSLLRDKSEAEDAVQDVFVKFGGICGGVSADRES